jgi:predicted nucleic acid-binding protein
MALLCDTSAIVSLILADDVNHVRCFNAVKDEPKTPMVSTWPCMTEAMYLLGREGGAVAQELLWQYIEQGALALHLTDEVERPRLRQLMKKYADSPMALADASLVSAAEQLSLRRILTLDRHFFAYRIHDTIAFEVVP